MWWMVVARLQPCRGYQAGYRPLGNRLLAQVPTCRRARVGTVAAARSPRAKRYSRPCSRPIPRYPQRAAATSHPPENAIGNKTLGATLDGRTD